MNFPMILQLPDCKPVIIDIAKPEMAEELVAFFKLNFCSVSPNSDIREYDAPPPEEEKIQHQFWIDLMHETLSSSHSLTAREETSGRLVAVIDNKMETPTTKHPEYPKRLLTAFLQDLTKDHDLFTIYRTEKVLAIDIVAVSSDFCKKRLATKLMELSIQLAIQSGAGAAQMEAVSEYTARSATKLGFTTLKAIDFAKFEYNGLKPFAGNEKMLSEHPTARFMARRLN